MSAAGPAPRRVEVAAGLVWRGRSVLCCSRPPDKVQAGFWEFPGGKLKDGEDARAALTRELGEELGIRVQQAEFWQSLSHDYEDAGIRVTLHFFHVTAFDGEPRPLEGQTAVWTDCSRLSAMNFLPADRELVASLEPPASAAAQN